MFKIQEQKYIIEERKPRTDWEYIYIYIKMGPLQGLGVHENKQNSKSFVNKKHSSTTSALTYPVKRIGVLQKIFHTNETISFNKFCISLLFPDIEHIYNLYVMSIENSLT